MRYPKPFKQKNHRHYYFIYNDEETHKRRIKSTRCDTRAEADEFVHNFMRSKGIKPISIDAAAPWIMNDWYRFSYRERSAILFARFEGKCQYCGCGVFLGGRPGLSQFGAEIDHVIPVSKGGDDSFGNCTLSCRRCNTEKRDKDILQFKASRDEKIS